MIVEPVGNLSIIKEIEKHIEDQRSALKSIEKELHKALHKSQLSAWDGHKFKPGVSPYAVRSRCGGYWVIAGDVVE